MSTTMETVRPTGTAFRGNDRLLFGMILGVVTFWLFAQSTLNISPVSIHDTVHADIVSYGALDDSPQDDDADLAPQLGWR